LRRCRHGSLKDENKSDSSYVRIYRPIMEVINASDLVAFREVMDDFPIVARNE